MALGERRVEKGAQSGFPERISRLPDAGASRSVPYRGVAVAGKGQGQVLAPPVLAAELQPAASGKTIKQIGQTNKIDNYSSHFLPNDHAEPWNYFFDTVGPLLHPSHLWVR
jgi:hypothetical protein